MLGHDLPHTTTSGCVCTTGAPQDSVICGYDSVLPACPGYSFPKGTPLVLCLGNPTGTPVAQCTTQLRVHPNVYLLPMWTNLSMLHLGKMSPSMLFATRWHLNQRGEDQLDWGPPMVTLTPCDSRLGGTCWLAEIRANSSENEIKLVAKHSVTFRPSRNAHLCLMETRWDHPEASRTCRTVKEKPTPYRPKVRPSYWRVATWPIAAATLCYSLEEPKEKNTSQIGWISKPVQIIVART